MCVLNQLLESAPPFTADQLQRVNAVLKGFARLDNGMHFHRRNDHSPNHLFTTEQKVTGEIPKAQAPNHLVTTEKKTQEAANYQTK